MSEVLLEKSSAADHLWREVRLTIYPTSHSIRWAVFLRKSRGADLVWQRNLSMGGLDLDPGGSIESGEGILRTVATALLETADAMSRTP
jgi:hypothetical protein